MNQIKDQTFYAPAARANTEKVLQQNTIFKNSESLVNIANSVSQILIALNKERQIVFANQQFRDLLEIHDDHSFLGKRTGEALNCIRSQETTSGCGTTKNCKTCGAVNAILEAQNGEQSIKEFSIILKNNEALDLRVKATPYEKNGENFTIYVISDISNQKRRQALERVFFHDVLNSAGGILGLSSILNEIEDSNEIIEIANLIHHSSNHLISEITLQQQISAAENGELQLNYTSADSLEMLQQISDLYMRHELSINKEIKIDTSSEKFLFETDILLLKRIVGNMLKNALEASFSGSCVILSAKQQANSPVFSVHNENFIEEKSQKQLFKRSFSTKGIGRGLGTYSMKLFGEKYLKGSIRFESTFESGTTFFIQLPEKTTID